MNTVITPEPHFIPGYTGHCPRYLYRVGGTYGNLTHRTLLAPCAGHSKELILMPTEPTDQAASPTKEELDALKFRQQFIDAVYCDPLIPGYDGFVPKLAAQIGKRYLAAAIAGVKEHETEMELLRCERRHLKHADMLDSGIGLFEPKMGERMISKALYRSPLIPVKNRSAAIEMEGCDVKKVKLPYSKFTIPHFMENDDEEKWIVAGYCGHIPKAKMRHGQSSKGLSRSALTDFYNSYRHRRFDTWCDMGHKPGVGNSSCPSNIDYNIYNYPSGFLPNYGGHVPGHLFKVGLRYALSTTDAKLWLREHRNKDYYEY